jgi:L-alanine-DL-glutamate epimerase-like enolase superfamily enzyme
MKIESVDFFYCSMPEVFDIGDGSQDALLVRIRGGGQEGWGECEASPLPSIASYVCPMSHSACKPLKYSLEGKTVNSPADIYKISLEAQLNSFDLLQANHTLSGLDIALWDLLGRRLGEPVYRLLGYKKSYGKLPYASQLFGDTPEETYAKAVSAKASGFRAIKFGWGPFGKNGLSTDIAHLEAARRGSGENIHLMIDAGTVWNNDVDTARARLTVLKKINAYWLEEPFGNLCVGAYQQLSQSQPAIALAGGEGCNSFEQADLMLQYAGLSFIQIDAGRIGGITMAKKVADATRSNNIRYVNHTFTSNLALSASLQPYAGIEEAGICEYPVELKPLARDLTLTNMLPDDNGYIQTPQMPGLGIEVDKATVKKYLQTVEIRVNGKEIYYTPDVG